MKRHLSKEDTQIAKNSEKIISITNNERNAHQDYTSHTKAQACLDYREAGLMVYSQENQKKGLNKITCRITFGAALRTTAQTQPQGPSVHERVNKRGICR